MRSLCFCLLVIPLFVSAGGTSFDAVRTMYDRRWSYSYIGAGYGGGFKIADSSRTTLNFHHNSAWGYGYNDLAFNVINYGRADYVIEGHFHPGISVHRLSGIGTFTYPLLDTVAALQFDWTDTHERVYSQGLELHLAPPASGHYLILGAFARKYYGYTGGTYALQFKTKFSLGRRAAFKLEVDAVPHSQGSIVADNFRADLSLIFDIGHTWYKAGSVFFVPKMRYWQNKLGQRELDETSVSCEIVFSV